MLFGTSRTCFLGCLWGPPRPVWAGAESWTEFVIAARKVASLRSGPQGRASFVIRRTALAAKKTTTATMKTPAEAHLAAQDSVLSYSVAAFGPKVRTLQSGHPNFPVIHTR